MTQRKALPLRLAVAALVVAATAIGAGTASARSAGALDLGKYASAQSCPSIKTTQPFKPWSDSGYYFLGPAANFEGSLTGWTAKNAKIVSGNETYYVSSKSDSHSLSLPGGSSVTSPSICVTLDTPDLRLFVKNSGGGSATLQINMTYTDNSGKAATATVAKLTIAGNAAWAPIAPVLFLSKISSILSSNNQTWVTFQLSSNGNLLVDDFYVDPIKHH